MLRVYGLSGEELLAVKVTEQINAESLKLEIQQRYNVPACLQKLVYDLNIVHHSIHFQKLLVVPEGTQIDLQLILQPTSTPSALQNEIYNACQNSNTQMVSWLLRAGADKDAQTEDGCTLLMCAAQVGSLEIAHLLLEAGADKGLTYGPDTALTCAIRNGHEKIARLLVEDSSDISRQALVCAASTPNGKILRWLLELGQDKISDDDRHAAFMCAVASGNFEATVLLLDVGVDKNHKAPAPVQAKIGRYCRFQAPPTTALTCAIREGHEEIVGFLLQEGALIDLEDLICAAALGHVEVLRLLVEARAALDVQDAKGYTALMHAAENRQAETATSLLRTGARKDLHNQNGTTALMCAVRQGSAEIVRLILDAGGAVDKEAVIDAVFQGNAKILHLLLEASCVKNMCMHYSLPRHRTLCDSNLFYANDSLKINVIRLLLQVGGLNDLWHGASQAVPLPVLVFATLGGCWHLALASARNSLLSMKELRLLLEASVMRHFPASEATTGCTALTLAAYHGKAGMVRMLLEAGTHKDQKGERIHNTALICAARRGHGEVVQLLLEAGADPDLWNANQQTALMYAAEAGHLQIVQALLSAGANMDLQNSLDWHTALMRAADNGHEKIVEQLLDSGADQNARDRGGLTALKIADCKGHVEIKRLL